MKRFLMAWFFCLCTPVVSTSSFAASIATPQGKHVSTAAKAKPSPLAKNAVRNALFGASLAPFIWGTLLAKDAVFGVVVPGGPSFGPLGGLAAVTAITSLTFVVLGAKAGLDYTMLWPACLKNTVFSPSTPKIVK